MRAIKATTIAMLAVGLLAGSVVAVAAQDEGEATVVTSFTGVFSPDGEPLPVETTSVTLPNGFIVAEPGFAWSNRLESTDPRLTGEHRVVVNWVLDPVGFGAFETGGRPNLLQAAVHEVINEGGSWRGEGTAFSSTELDLLGGEVVTLVGQGGYEGMTAYALIEGSYEPPRISGVIFPTAMPKVPEPYVGE